MKLVFFMFSTLLFTPAASAQSTWDMDSWNWQNIVNILPSTQDVDTLSFPNQVLRPYRGSHIRVTIPASCGDIRFSGITAYERDRFNQRLALDLKRIGQTIEHGEERYYYRINSGPATAFEIGMKAWLSTPGRCEIVVEQANRDGGFDECAQYRNLVCTAVYSPSICTARTFSGRFLSQERGGNSCSANVSLALQLCEERSLHRDRDYQIVCRPDRF